MHKNDLQSRTINALRFLLVLYVVVIHAYTSTRGDVNAALYPGYRFISFLFSLEIAQIAVPGLFFISGYLFFYREEPYGIKLKKEVRRLWVPYLFWNGSMVLLYFCLQSIPVVAPYFSGENLPVRDYTPTDFLRAFWDSGQWKEGNGTPILSPFWYVRNLILLGVASPLIREYIRWFRGWGVAALLIVWLFIPGQAFMVESVALFAAGGFFSYNGKDFLPVFQKYSKTVYVLYPVLVAANMAMRDSCYLLPLDRLSFLAGIVFTTVLVADILRRYGCESKFSDSLRPLGFFIFAIHSPLLIFIQRLALKYSPSSDFSRIAIYVGSTLLVVAICVAVYRMLARFAPGLLGVMTGQKGSSFTKKRIEV